MTTTEVNGQVYVRVADFYAGKSVFVTGATGFLGKVLIEKLLYSCPDVRNIYVLIREKLNENAADRMESLINSPVFTRIRNERPKDLRKIIPITGDISLPDLGLDHYDEDMLINEVSVVFHSAAIVKFNELLTIALNINLEGTQKVLNLCKRMKKIEVFVHMSTAYSNTDKEVIEEIVYPSPTQLSEVYKFIQQYGDNKRITANILNGRPNTYTFTKALAENLIVETNVHFPTIIIRPSIVTPSINEPLRGWVDNWYGATTFLTFIGKGFCRFILGKDDNILDLIPVDYVSNLTLLSAARLHSSKGVTVLNSSTSSVNPITLEEVQNMYVIESVRNGFNNLPFPGALITNKEWLVKLINIILKTIAYIIDLWLRISGKKPRFVTLQGKSEYIMKVLSYFTNHSWEIKCDGALMLYNTLDEHDRQLFPCDPKTIDWKQYIQIYFEGVKRYLIQCESD